MLGDIPRVASCLPGAELTETVDASTYRGTVQLAVGPLRMSYLGTATVMERDDATRTMVVRAEGRDRRGGGSAAADLTIRLAEDAPTRIDIASEVRLTGRMAALGRGVSDVATKLFEEFATRLGAELAPPTDRPAKVRDNESAPESQLAPAPAGENSLRLGQVVRTVLRERLARLLISLGEKVHP